MTSSRVSIIFLQILVSQFCLLVHKNAVGERKSESMVIMPCLNDKLQSLFSSYLQQQHTNHKFFSPLENILHEESPGAEKFPLLSTYFTSLHDIPTGPISVSVKFHLSWLSCASSVNSNPFSFASSLFLYFLSHAGNNLSSQPPNF